MTEYMKVFESSFPQVNKGPAIAVKAGRLAFACMSVCVVVVGVK